MEDLTPYAFCRYTIRADGQELSPREQKALLTDLRGVMFAYRVREPTTDDMDTFLAMPRSRTINGRIALSWRVSQHLSHRRKVSYDRTSDQMTSAIETTDEERYTTFIAIPELGVAAINDRVGDHALGAKAGIARFETCLRFSKRAEASVDLGGSTSDVLRALESWELERFTFTVKPFNPHPGDLGRKLHQMFEAEGVGSLRGVATPQPNGKMVAADGGVISEAVGLAEAGYGQFGLTGRTPEGLEATLEKPAFSQDTKSNKKRQAKPRSFRVYVPGNEADKDHEEEVVKALLSFYD